jgi:hypothetical protein
MILHYKKIILFLIISGLQKVVFAQDWTLEINNKATSLTGHQKAFVLERVLYKENPSVILPNEIIRMNITFSNAQVSVLATRKNLKKTTSQWTGKFKIQEASNLKRTALLTLTQATQSLPSLSLQITCKSLDFKQRLPIMCKIDTFNGSPADHLETFLDSDSLDAKDSNLTSTLAQINSKDVSTSMTSVLSFPHSFENDDHLIIHSIARILSFTNYHHTIIKNVQHNRYSVLKAGLGLSLTYLVASEALKTGYKICEQGLTSRIHDQILTSGITNTIMMNDQKVHLSKAQGFLEGVMADRDLKSFDGYRYDAETYGLGFIAGKNKAAYQLSKDFTLFEKVAFTQGYIYGISSP